LTPAEVSSIVGGSLPTSRQVPGGGWVAGQCAWSSSEAAFLLSVGTPASIKAVGDPGVLTAMDKLEEFAQRNATGGAAKPFEGVGDGAIVAESGMAAYRGEFYLEVMNLRLTETQMIEIVKRAVNRL
jgi:hypothetical protein